jgi:ribose transport system permease protein
MKHLRRWGTLLGFLLIVAFFTTQKPDTFLTARNLLNISQQVSMLAVVAFAMTAVMAMGDFDLSVGAMASLAGVVAAVLFAAGWPLWAGLLAALAVGLLGGLLNGILVAALGILPFVATLGTLTMFSGAAFLVSDGRTIFGRDIPEAFGAFARGGFEIGAVLVPSLSLVALAVLLLVWVLLEHTTFGRRLYAIGGNAEAARLAGVPVRRLRATAFCITGLGAAVAGLMYASRVASANPTQGDGLMLDAIAAVFLGMTMSEDAEPRALATLVGVLILAVLDNGLTQMAVDSYLREVLVGAIILLAVASSRLGLDRG